MLSTLKKIGVRCAVYKVISRLFPQDDLVLSYCDRIGAYRYLSKYKYVLDRMQADYSKTQGSGDIVWLCWLQGYDNAPELVKRCRESVVRHNPGKKIVIIDNENVEEYIDIPEHIKRKHSRGIIPFAHYSDYIRVSLLAKYGGTWIDSTMFLTGPVPQYIDSLPLFFFRSEFVGKVYGANNFIAACPDNPIILQTKELLNEYWLHENKLVSYSIFHLFWTMVLEYNEQNRCCLDKVPFVPSLDTYLLQKDMFDTYSDDRFGQIKSITPIHKLTYRFSEEEASRKDTFYQYLLRQ